MVGLFPECDVGEVDEKIYFLDLGMKDDEFHDDLSLE
jgi:hypothetical protein